MDEMLKQTSGLASPQLVYSHWEVSQLEATTATTTFALEGVPA